MKKGISNIVVLFLALFSLVASCKKDSEVNKDTFKIENEKVMATTQSVLITGTYVYSGVIDGITIELGRQSDLMDGDAYRALLEDTDFSIEVKNLRTNVTYYYRYAVDYGGKSPYLTEIKSFKTQEYNMPEVKSMEVVSVGMNRAEVSGEVLSDGGGDAVTLRGICWSTSHNPSVGEEYANAGEGIGTFVCELTNLQPEKTYYARAFAGNSKGVSYGEELTFVTLTAGSLAEVSTVGITGNAMLQATVNGEVTNEGTSAVIERGVCYGKDHYPTTSGLHVIAGSGAGEYSCQLTNLEANATYYVRAYAINSLGIAYGDEMSFVAQSETTAPVVQTGMVSDITISSATGHGTVVSDGGVMVTRRGLCWSTEHNPTANDTHADCGNGVGDFSGLMPHLTDMTTYYVRAYAENAVGMAYGEEVSFTVGQHEHPEPPTVTTSAVTDISATTAISGGNVANGGGAEVTERGICWSTSFEPTIEDNHTSNGTGLGTYSCMMTGLAPATMYYVRAYAVNEYGLSYGEQREFVTEAALATIVLDEISGAMISYRVTEDGGAEVVEHGVCYSTSHDPTMSDNHVSGGSGIGSFTVELTDLQPGMTYYLRLYATNSVGTAYGQEYSFTTGAELPSVTTLEVGDITTTTAVGSGEVTDDGGATVTLRGICWSTSHDPTTSSSHVNSGTGLGSFTCNMTGLTPNTLYYVRAYAHNSAGTAYGNEVSFTTETPGPGDEFVVDFESGMPAGWTIIDANNDGYTWCLTSAIPTTWEYYAGVTLDWYHNGTNAICSGSYINGAGALNPDEYFVSPLVNLGASSQLSFWVAATDTSYPADHFGVFVSDNGTSNWTSVQEWTLTGKKEGMAGGAASRDGRGLRIGTWYNYTVDLSAYVGQKYIAFRHFNCYDQYIMCLDDIELSNAKK